MLSDTTRDAADRLVARYPVARSALLPLLHLVQAEQGYVTEEGIAFCASKLGLTKAEVGAVATFYTMFKREPVGDYLVSVCTNPTCKIAGAQVIYERFQDKLGGHHDEETKTSVEHAECLGICDAAPVIQVNYEMYGPVDDKGADEILEGCRKGEPPASNWSGEVPKTFTEVEWELSGAADGVDDVLAAAARHQVTAYDNPPAYKSGETDIPVTHPGGDPMGHGGEVFRERTAAAQAMAQLEAERATGATGETVREATGSDDVPAATTEAPAAEPTADAPVTGEPAADAGGDQPADDHSEEA